MNLCDGYELNGEFLVNYAKKGKQVMILDIGAPVSLAGKEWITQYLREHGLEIEDMRKDEFKQMFVFGTSWQYESTEMIKPYYLKQKKLVKIDGMRSIEQVSSDIQGQLVNIEK